MSLPGDIERAAEAAVPGLRGARLAFYVAIVLAGLLLAGLVWWAVFIRPAMLAADAAQGKVDGKLGTAAASIAAEAIPQINDANRQKVDVDIHVQKDQADVRSAPDAGTEIRGVSDAVLRSVCLHNEAAADSACLALHEDPAVVGPAR